MLDLDLVMMTNIYLKNMMFGLLQNISMGYLHIIQVHYVKGKHIMSLNKNNIKQHIFALAIIVTTLSSCNEGEVLKCATHESLTEIQRRAVLTAELEFRKMGVEQGFALTCVDVGEVEYAPHKGTLLVTFDPFRTAPIYPPGSNIPYSKTYVAQLSADGKRVISSTVDSPYGNWKLHDSKQDPKIAKP
jgi:hypothetical protein